MVQAPEEKPRQDRAGDKRLCKHLRDNDLIRKDVVEAIEAAVEAVIEARRVVVQLET